MKSEKPKSKKAKIIKVIVVVFILGAVIWELNRSLKLSHMGAREWRDSGFISDTLCRYVEKHQGNMPSSWADLENEGLCQKGDQPYSIIIDEWVIDTRKYKIAFGLKPKDIYFAMDPSQPGAGAIVHSKMDHKPKLIISPTGKSFCGPIPYERNSYEVALNMRTAASLSRINSAREDSLAPKE